jgi:hypothetical protein
MRTLTEVHSRCQLSIVVGHFIDPLIVGEVMKELKRQGEEPSLISGMPLPTQLSHALVAYTIEFDNESERRMPHRTSRHGSTDGHDHAPWLVSLVMWSNCMQYVIEDGVSVRKLEELARTKTNLSGMQRWGYIIVEANSTGDSPSPRAGWIIRATANGREARDVWRPLFGEIEERWQARFGHETVDPLRKVLDALTGQFEFELPDCLPILGYGLFSRVPGLRRLTAEETNSGVDSQLPLSALLSRALLAFAVEFESGSELSLAICANVVRLLSNVGVPLRDLPRLAAISKEAVAVSLNYLQKNGYAIVEPESPASRAKAVVLTAKGEYAQTAYHQRLREVEESWEDRYGLDIIRTLVDTLKRLVGEPTAKSSPLFRGLEPYPEGWRASIPRPERLPHFPMVTHRGGFPDGS